MPRKPVRSLRCPTCKKLVLRTDPEFPFCGERCRLIDLGKWASGAYVVRGPAFDPEQPESIDDSDGGEHRPGPNREPN
ncbi:MAG: DNA gyrase inhibitor YacG [Acidobacteria bacterium]|nr:DNA gyrase inhibitor YacG [Acidobacteriota bacterium]